MAVKKPKVYLDTSVISAYDDARMPERQAQTKEFWKTLKSFNVCISEITLQEIANIPDGRKRKKLLGMTAAFEKLLLSAKANELAEKYLTEKLVPKKYRVDALHLAIAVVNKAEILVSWNCKHLVNLKTKYQANKINQSLGYRQIELVEPPMIKI